MSQQNPLFGSLMKCPLLAALWVTNSEKNWGRKSKITDTLAFAFQPLGLLELEAQSQWWKYPTLRIQGLDLKEISENCFLQSHQILGTGSAKEA